MRSILITGTDTGIGKTHVTGIIGRQERRRPRRLWVAGNKGARITTEVGRGP